MGALQDQFKMNIAYSQYYEAIFDSYQNYNIKNAIFIAERLRYVQENDQNLCLLAELYLADNVPFKAYSILKNVRSTRGRYLFAVAAMRINKLEEAEQALLPDGFSNPNYSINQTCDKVVNGAHGLYLLGQINERMLKRGTAINCYEHAFYKNQTLFLAFEKVSHLSQSKEVPQITMSILRSKTTNQAPVEIKHSVIKSFITNSMKDKEDSSLTDASLKKPSGNDLIFPLSFQQQKSIVRQITKNSNAFPSTIGEAPIPVTSSVKKQSPKINKKSTDFGVKMMQQSSESNSFGSFYNQPNSMVKMQHSVSNAANKCSDTMTLQEHLALLGKPYYDLLGQRIHEALNEFKSLKRPLDNDPWVLANMGRCYTEISNHTEAENYFKKCFEREPYRTESADYYSSCLWQLNRKIDLSKLSYSMIQNQFLAPEAWIAHANCYSLIKDHDSAITYLLRAVQIDPFNSYAYCLIGHEYVNKDNFEKARDYYQKAVKYDPKNVRALFGLGSLKLNAGNYQQAIENFTSAIKINSQCSTFYTQLGIAYKHRNAFEDALVCFNKAEEINESEKINRFNKADVLFKLGRFDEAICECRRVLNDAKESTVYFLLGTIYQKKGDMNEALKNFELAMKIDKNETSKIKQCIASLELMEAA